MGGVGGWGLLLGVKEDCFVVLQAVKITYSESVLICHKDTNTCWELVNVYGPVHDNKKT